ncbi:uncharacterized protein [Penaeus vannamei]|uniref:uncharacterized protein n=1 Tax=Penaeus vannamei TaxID=6689 RepID=UPI00387F9B2A
MSRLSKDGRSDLRNMSSKRLTNTEIEALSLGPKFSTRQGNKDLIDYVVSNHCWTDSEETIVITQAIKVTKARTCCHLLEEAPRNPSMRGVPKAHKPCVPMRHITSGFCSALHRLAKCLATPLSTAMEVISDSHLKNSADLIRHGAIRAVDRFTGSIVDDELPLPKHHFISLVKLCVYFGFFEFAGDEYHQISGLAMGSPLSAVLACLFLETLERGHYRNIIGRHSIWLRYIDDVLIIVPRRSCLHPMLTRLNSFREKILFTVEEEDQKFPFLDSLINRGDNDLRFSAYRKPTNKDDYIHCYSAHSNKTKSGVVIGFFLRALRICSPEFLEAIGKYFGNTMNIASTSREKIDDLIREKKTEKQRQQNTYYGETGRGFNTRINEHGADGRHHKTSNTMVVHVDEAGHLSNWKEAEITHEELSKKGHTKCIQCDREKYEHRNG